MDKMSGYRVTLRPDLSIVTADDEDGWARERAGDTEQCGHQQALTGTMSVLVKPGRADTAGCCLTDTAGPVAWARCNEERVEPGPGVKERAREVDELVGDAAAGVLNTSEQPYRFRGDPNGTSKTPGSGCRGALEGESSLEGCPSQHSRSPGVNVSSQNQKPRKKDSSLFVMPDHDTHGYTYCREGRGNITRDFFNNREALLCRGRSNLVARIQYWIWAFILLWNTHVLHAQGEVAPSFQTEPGVQQVSLEGNRLVLTCLATGSWPLEYKWIRNGTDITPFTPEYRFSVLSVERSDAGVYQCVVRNRMGALIQRRADVQVAWMKLRRAITLENQLVVLATTVADAGRYYVQAVNERNGENKTSPALYLSISMKKRNRAPPEPNAPTDPVAPAIVISPKNTSVVAGASEATLECVANARPVERLQLVWKRAGVRVTQGVGAFGRRLTVSNPAQADAGLYVCEALLRNSTFRTAEARAYLTVLEAPYFTYEPKQRLMVEVDKSVEIRCQARGVPAPKLEWFKDAVPLATLNNTRYKLTASSLQVRRVQPEDSGIFQCFSRNAAGEVEAHTHLIVTSLAPYFTVTPSDITVTDGTSALFVCQTSGAPKPAIVWKKGSQVLASGSVQIPRFTLLESGGLQIEPIVPGDAGNYTCYAANTEGAVDATSALTVWSRTFISREPEDQRVIKGTTAVLDCGATYDPRVTVRYVWKKGPRQVSLTPGGRISVRDGALHLSQTWSGDIGDYTCKVISQAGNDTKTARLEVIELPHSPRNLQAALNATDSRTVHLSWVRPFDGNSPLLHYIIELSENMRKKRGI
ncbi:protein sidekick-1 [Sardina pilchardus]|uniref:protein sidekick-1 n=1 Tax=Sardina pilchardus TaxID=27697 RepID=UPI002E106BF9